MIDKACAKEIRDFSLAAISSLSSALNASLNRCSEQDYERIKRGVGLSIGTIQFELLDVICEMHPDLDDLRE